MRLNRVLLLAASFSILIFAMVFTISCSGDDGKDGKNGKSCTVEEKGSGSYDVICGDDVVGHLGQGPKGDKGEDAPGAVENNCVLGKKVGDSYEIVCGTTTVSPGSSGGGSVPADVCRLGEEKPAGSGKYTIVCDGKTIEGGEVQGSVGGCKVEQKNRYNDYELTVTCSGSSAINLCGGAVYDKGKQFCTNASTRQIDANKDLYNTQRVRSNATGLPGGATGDVGGVIMSLADFECTLTTGESQKYNPNEFFCKPAESGAGESYVNNKLVPVCGAGDYTYKQFCLKGKSGYENVVKRCSGTTGSPGVTFTSTQFCQVKLSVALGALVYGDYESINTDAVSSVKNLCGQEYDKVIVNTKFEIPHDYSGGEFYDNLTYANGNPVPVVTGSSYRAFVGGSTECKDGKVLTKCQKINNGLTEYFDARTQFCVEKNSNATIDTLLIKPLCLKTGATMATGKYDDVIYFCNPATGNGEKKCGGAFYPEETKFCWGTATAGDIGVKCVGGPNTIAPSLNPPVSPQVDVGGGNLGNKDKYNTANYDPKKFACGYLPDLYSDMVWAETDEGADPGYDASRLTKAYRNKEVALPICSGTKINDGAWQWQFCTGGNTGTVSYCGEKQVPNPDDLGGACKTCGLIATEVTPGQIIITASGEGYCKCAGSNVLSSTNKCVTPCTGSQVIDIDGTCKGSCSSGFLDGNVCKTTCDGGKVGLGTTCVTKDACKAATLGNFVDGTACKPSSGSCINVPGDKVNNECTALCSNTDQVFTSNTNAACAWKTAALAAGATTSSNTQMVCGTYTSGNYCATAPALCAQDDVPGTCDTP